MVDKDFNSISELMQRFPDEISCMEYLEKLRWGGVVLSPFDRTSKVYKCKDNKYRCKNTGKYFNAKTFTLFGNTKIELQKWFIAIWLIVCKQENLSPSELAKNINVTKKTASNIIQEIKKCYSIKK